MLTLKLKMKTTLFDKFFGRCFIGLAEKPQLNSTLGIAFKLHSNATGNSVSRRLAFRGFRPRTVNKSRFMR